MTHPGTWIWQWTIALLAVTVLCWNLVSMVGPSHADMPDDLDGTCWSSTDKGCWWKDTRWHTPKRVNKKWNTCSWGKRPWWCYGWHYDYNSRASQGYNDKRWYDLGRVATEQWRSGRLGNLMEGAKGLRKLQMQPM